MQRIERFAAVVLPLLLMTGCATTAAPTETSEQSQTPTAIPTPEPTAEPVSWPAAPESAFAISCADLVSDAELATLFESALPEIPLDTAPLEATILGPATVNGLATAVIAEFGGLTCQWAAEDERLVITVTLAEAPRPASGLDFGNEVDLIGTTYAFCSNLEDGRADNECHWHVDAEGVQLDASLFGLERTFMGDRADGWRQQDADGPVALVIGAATQRALDAIQAYDAPTAVTAWDRCDAVAEASGRTWGELPGTDSGDSYTFHIAGSSMLRCSQPLDDDVALTFYDLADGAWMLADDAVAATADELPVSAGSDGVMAWGCYEAFAGAGACMAHLRVGDDLVAVDGWSRTADFNEILAAVRDEAERFVVA